MSERVLRGITNRLCRNTLGGYLYGSAKQAHIPGHDIDILIVCHGHHKPRVRCQLALLQISVDILIHAVLISPEELSDNRALQSILDDAERLW